MEATGSDGVGTTGGGTEWRWWALASTVQFIWGVSSYRKGCPGDSRLMPMKAMGVASLFVGCGATASFAALRASGIYKVEDLRRIGRNIRTAIGAPPRVRKEK